MLIHPFFRTLASRPDLLADHAGAYAALAQAELGEAARRWRQRLLWMTVAAVLALLALGLAGVALLLVAALPVAQMPAAWVLAALPATLATLALGLLLWQLRSGRGQTVFDAALWREQWAQDQALWQEASGS
ncbi:hypothetical protein [Ideonella oryzae]|uniref:Phage holin family protein n=1 Tax=Ideonella oryzae TaxID=2937441 RepID=A0ABT1BQF2_9BURK|nr:hypothetical protein [Ideonella oryzae]MCO5978139.1 hypothetical protein [Ideonella oryzae]